MNKLSTAERIKRLEERMGISENKPAMKRYAIEPPWGRKAILTEEFLSQVMFLDGVRYHRHRHGGGWVSEKARVERNVWVGPLAIVHNGVIKDQVVISDMASINCMGTQVGFDSNISGSARISGSAHILGFTHISDSAHIFSFARVSGSARVSDSAQISDSAHILDFAHIFGSAHIFGLACISGCGSFGKTTNKSMELGLPNSKIK